MSFLSRRDFLAVAAATAALYPGSGALRRAAAQARITAEDILRFDPKGQLTLLHLTDLHAQTVPVWFREASINLGVGDAAGLFPHLTGERLLERFGLTPGSPEAYMLASEDFAELARTYGRVGGLDRVATLVKAVRAERGPERVLLLDGGDTWQGSWPALQTRGRDMVELMALLQPDAMTAHWEFTLGEKEVLELIEGLGFPFLGQNVRDTEFEDPVFEGVTYLERGGVKVAVIGQAFPYTPIANPRWMIPQWSFGVRESELRELVRAAREEEGAGLVVLLSHNGFDVDRKLAGRVEGIDVILCGHTHDAAPEPIRVGRTLLVASGCHGKFLSRLDLDVGPEGVRDFAFKLMPVLADAIPPEPEMAAAVERTRAPYRAELDTVVGRTESLLYRRGNFGGTFDDVICAALREGRDAEIALSPGFRWGTSLLPGAEITKEFVWSHTAMTYPAVYRSELTGQQLKDILEDVADNLFNPDPYYQQGGDMVRTGGLGFAIDPHGEAGRRISELTLLETGAPIEAGKRYVVAGWASVNEGVEGPPVWDLVIDHVRRARVVRAEPTTAVRVAGL